MVKGWIVDEEGVLEEKELRETNVGSVFIEQVPLLFGFSMKHHLLNHTFFKDEMLALRKGIDNARSYQGILDERIVLYHLMIKELEKREIIMNNEKREAEEKAFVEAANKKLLEDVAPKPYDLGRGVYFTNKEYSNTRGTIITQYLGDPFHLVYDLQTDDMDIVRVQHDEIYALERGTCR